MGVSSHHRCFLMQTTLLCWANSARLNSIRRDRRTSSSPRYSSGRPRLELVRCPSLMSAREFHGVYLRAVVYWAPELLKLEGYGKQVDLWALGVTFYQLVTGQHPFEVADENKFRDEALTGSVNWEPLQACPLPSSYARPVPLHSPSPFCSNFPYAFSLP